MILRYFGHSLFTIALESGTVILTDPYGVFYDYPRHQFNANIVTVSHQHHDHNAVDMMRGNPTVIDRVGVFSPEPGVIITGIASKHDAQNGAKRGDNIIFIIEAEEMKLVHMGDIGHVITDRQRHQIGTPDVLMLPVGGNFTTDAEAAAENVRLLKPHVAIPMHYQTQYNRDMPIQTEQPFLSLMRVQPEPMPLCRFTKGDLSQRPAVILMAVTTTS
ncbi:MAG: MBL fold metallo-hydrolase [Eubacteriales bacterium]|nr:MBL fold metallo-hydrolase [Eubacteriales bacterium]